MINLPCQSQALLAAATVAKYRLKSRAAGFFTLDVKSLIRILVGLAYIMLLKMELLLALY